MKLYMIDEGSARYWVCATNIKEALDVHWKGYEDRGEVETITDIDTIDITIISESYAKQIVIDDDGTKTNAYDLMIKAGKPEVLGCSEWP